MCVCVCVYVQTTYAYACVKCVDFSACMCNIPPHPHFGIPYMHNMCECFCSSFDLGSMF